MKKFLKLIFLIATVGVITSCSEDKVIEEEGTPGFPLREGLELLEVTVPPTTGLSDKIYIIGEFNGGLEAIGNPQWLLEKSFANNSLYGIYLNPADFIKGKSLADGYTFYNDRKGEEKSNTNQPVFHKTSPGKGKRAEINIEAWASNFPDPENPDKVIHDGFVIYVIDETSYDQLGLYAWGEKEAFGKWPGILPTGEEKIEGITYKYFDTFTENEGLSLSLIFNNNNNGKQLEDYGVTLDKDYYFRITDSSVTEINPDGSPIHDGFSIFVYNSTGWTSLYLYAWGEVNNLFGSWPGMIPTGEVIINGVIYSYFDTGEGNQGLEESLIFNNGSAQLKDFQYKIDKDLYLEISTSGVTEIDPDTFTPSK